MSVRTMAKVWADSQHSGTELLMLLAIADFADDDGRAYPAVQTLAEKCRMKPRNANYVLSALRASGELEILANQGPKGTNVYRVNLEGLGLQPVAPLQRIAPLQHSARTPAKDCAKPLQPIADEPSLNHQEPPRKTRASKSRDALKDVEHLLIDVDRQVLKDWLVVRKAKKAGDLTETVLTQFAKQAATAGLSKTEAMRFCCEAGWGRFNAGWYANSQSTNSTKSNRRPASDFSTMDYGALGALTND